MLCFLIYIKCTKDCASGYYAKDRLSAKVGAFIIPDIANL
ncbi:hypothetical protein SBF1_8040001 [Candidatus Desulfosporosinus infrequens]|uniref:Uncharacterized protein n=1 Tax=Candidatus Desulfosporosinus infrequens TaxID=2043169 RepID=A0A2U3LTP7_9FIRM|nr:hypothetical protein SBF1_8040001 [Candidatus Desulfosporosinus infrequens]